MIVTEDFVIFIVLVAGGILIACLIWIDHLNGPDDNGFPGS